MFERLKRALVESYVGAVALGYPFAQAIMHFVNIFASPVSAWAARKGGAYGALQRHEWPLAPGGVARNNQVLRALANLVFPRSLALLQPTQGCGPRARSQSGTGRLNAKKRRPQRYCFGTMHHMKTASVRDLRYRFPEIEAQMRQGNEIQITKRKRVIAHLTPVNRPRQWPDFMARLKKIYGNKKSKVTGAEIVREQRGPF